jgi:endogenous inhibitor of DNA gyrase (YacG/DUF329 family)
VKCPACDKPALFAPSNPWRPFCSERCKTMDLGAWAAEQYRVPVKPGEGDDGGDPPDARDGAGPQGHDPDQSR